jgi:hypothetical protein
MLQTEIQAARDKLRQAGILIGEVRGLCITGGHAHGTRITHEIQGLIADVILGLDALQRIQDRDEPREPDPKP